MNDKEKPTKNEFEKWLEECDLPSLDYNAYLEAMYGHGYVSSDSDLAFSDELADINHLINVDKNEAENQAELPEEFEELEKAYDESICQWATEKIKRLESEKFNEGSLYFSSVSKNLQKAFKYATEILREIAHKNGGYIRVNDSYVPASNQASVEIIARGVHFENDRTFRSIMRFFGFVEISYRDDNEVSVTFIRPDYFGVKEVKL